MTKAKKTANGKAGKPVKANKYGRNGLTAKQKRLVQQLPAVVAGRKSKKQALLDAGYSKKSAEQQAGPLGSIRTNTAMQQALRDAGFTEEVIAKNLMQGVTMLRPSRPKLAYLEVGAKLLDAFPAEKHIHAETTIDDLIKGQEGGDTLAP